MIDNIKQNDGYQTIVAEFGCGDINVASGVGADEITPIVNFWNGSPCEIGSDNQTGIYFDENNRPRVQRDYIRFIFNKKESIDVIIHHLNECKKLFDVPEDERLKTVCDSFKRKGN